MNQDSGVVEISRAGVCLLRLPSGFDRARRAVARAFAAASVTAAACLLSGGCGSPEEGAEGRFQRSILIVLDAARADRFGTNGYDRDTTPELDRLAMNGVVFTHHYTQATSTRPALPTLLYSRYFVPPILPYSRQVPFAEPEELFRSLDDQAVSLPAALAQAGFTTAMISAHSWTLPESAMAREFDEAHHLPRLVELEPWSSPTARQAVEYTIDWIDDHAAEDFFIYLHLMDTHFPHQLDRDAKRFLPAGVAPGVDRSRFDGRKFLDKSLAYSDADRIYLSALYDGSLYSTDRQLGRLFDYLERRGWLTSTLIVVTADHGEHLLEHPDRWEHGGPWYEPVARIPLIVSYPDALEQGRSSMLSDGVDVMPTMLGLLEVALPEGKSTDGIDLVEALRGQIPPRRYAFSSYGALRDPRFKCIFDADRERLLAGEAPDLSELTGEIYLPEEDPSERIDLWPERPEVALRCLQAYREHLRGRYDRFLTSVTTTQPDGPFAIASNHLGTQVEVPTMEAQATAAESDRRHPWPSDWIQSKHWQGHQIFAPPGATPREVWVRVPDGLYEVSLGMTGAARVRLPGTAAPVELDSERPARFDPASRQETEELALGQVEVRDQTLRFSIEPLSSSALLLRYIGFSPVAATGEELHPEDAERLRRLEALGYLE